MGQVTDAGAKFVKELTRVKMESKAEAMVHKVLRSRPAQETLSDGLAHCASRGLVPCMRLLLEANASADARNQEGRTALQLAAGRGHVDACKLLVSAGANRQGALEAVKELTLVGATFAEERKQIEALLQSFLP